MAPSAISFRDPGAARADGYVLATATVLVAIDLLFHPVPSGGFERRPSVLQTFLWLGYVGIFIARAARP